MNWWRARSRRTQAILVALGLLLLYGIANGGSGSSRSSSATPPPSTASAATAAAATSSVTTTLAPASATVASAAPIAAATIVSSTSPAASVATSSVCAGRDPKANIYHPDRLVLLNGCVTATGTVATVRREADGDYHIGLRLDPGQESLVNAKNASGQNGNLVLEIICAITVTQADAVSSCATYTNTIAPPRVGSHIGATGPFVLDQEHGWQEIHPVWSITTQ